MRKLLLTILPVIAISIGCSQASNFDKSHQALTGILKTYVNSEGQVNYSALKTNRSALDVYLDSTATVSKQEFNTWSEADRIAFLINVYNAETLQLIIDHYPVAQIQKIAKNPWKLKSVKLFGGKTTLDHVEHGILRVDYNEPRIHFALVCAAVSCPPLRAEAFTGANLDAQLEDQTKIFLKETAKNRVAGNTLYLSAIFQWFEGDFTKTGNTLAQYVDPYFPESTANKTVKFNDYSWNLNSQ